MKTNFHMHTSFCDGKNSPEEMVISALAENACQIGFSGHSYLGDDHDPSWTMDENTALAYRAEISRLKAKYQKILPIFLGIEQDFYSPSKNLNLYDYIIGGVHCVYEGDKYISVDEDLQSFQKAVSEDFGGDVFAFIKKYYECVENLYDKTHCDIIAHFDLITKFIEQKPFFNINDQAYKKSYAKALESLIESKAVFEINFGGIKRGYRSSPYPSDDILQAIAKANKPVIFSSDSHTVGSIFYGFEEFKKITKKFKLRVFKNLDEILTYSR